MVLAGHGDRTDGARKLIPHPTRLSYPVADVALGVAGTDQDVDETLRMPGPGVRIGPVRPAAGDPTTRTARLARRTVPTLVGSRRTDGVLPRAIDLAAGRKNHLTPPLSAAFPLAKAGETGAAAVREGFKVLVRPGRGEAWST